ncbi:MAG: YcgN family cysteine cluster protein, partial [Candidatus Puniceispirillaceae bacterium]
MPKNPFWKTIPLEKLDKDQWESLCDGCGKCCVLKLEDVDTGEVHYTDVGCKLLDCKTARCSSYEKRKSFVPDCVMLTPDNLGMLSWMPKSCAYRLIYENKDLPDWHP